MTASSISDTSPQGQDLNAGVLKRNAWWEQFTQFGLCSPALLLVLIILVLPVGWLFSVSFIGASGEFLLSHLHHHIPGQPAQHRIVYPDRISVFIFSIATAKPPCIPVSDHGFTAILDIPAGAHLCLAGPVTAQRPGQ